MKRFLYFLALVLIHSGLSAQNFIKKFNSVSGITAVNGKIFFVADDGTYGQELWITDGTPEGTRLVKDIAPGYNSANPSYLTSFNNQLFFVAYSPQYGNEVWKSDGTEAGTVLLSDLYAGDGNGSDPRALTLYNNELYFDASPDGFNRSIYKSNGTSAGTVLLKDMGFGEITDIEVAGSYLYFVFGIGKLWRSNGTFAGTVEVPVDEYFFIKRLTAVGSQLFFTTSYTENVNVRLYTLTGTSTPAMLKEFSAPVSSTNELTNFTAVGSKLFFSVQNNLDQQDKTDDLWWSDGTTPGTVMIKSFAWNPQLFNSAMKNFFAFNGNLYFQNGSSEDDAWWKSDGTEQGTVEVSPVRLGYPSYGSYIPVVSNGKIFLSGDGELWTSDGTTSGTQEYFDIDQGGYSVPNSLADVNNVLYFAANDGYGAAIWNIVAAGEIDVLDPFQSSIRSNGSLQFETTLTNDCSSQIIEIRNVGAKEVVLADMTVSGKDFYIGGQVPAILKPNEKFPINVFFLPFSSGARNGTLTIRSNDSNESSYIINLSGTGDSGTSTTFCEAYESDYLKKTLTAGGQSAVTISNNTILENQSAGTTVGTLSASGSGNTFSLVSGEGDTDNAKFVLDGNTLKSQVTFDYASKNIYTIRVKAQNAGGSTEGQLTIHVLELPSNSLPASDCLPVVTRINAGLLDAEYNASGHLFVCGEGGKFLKSTDAGATWTTLNSGVTIQLTRLVFKGTVGYAAGDGVLLRSEDNGDTWSELYLPNDAPVAGKTLFLLDADVGFVASLNGEIFKTTNGGVTWLQQGEGLFSAPTSLHFWDEDNGIACTVGAVLKTLNGGVTWNLVNTLNLGDSQYFTNITFLNNDVGFMTSLTNLFTSVDGGEQWSEVVGIGGLYFQEVRFVTNNIGYVIGGYPSSELFMSTDGGINWDVVPSSPLTAARGIGYQSGTNKVVVVGANTPDLSSTEPGSVIMTSTAGTTVWDIKHELHSEEFYAVIFSSTTTGYAAGADDIYKTTNGGETWKKLNQNKPVYGVAFLDNNNGYMADGLEVYSTSNGGTSWTPRFSSGSSDLKHLIALSANAVLAYSESGVIYRYNGTTWPVVFNQPLNQLQQVHFPTASVGYGVDLLGKVIKTTNGGVNWSVVYTHAVGGESFNTIYFFNANEGLMAGGNGVLYKTVNAGVNWTKVFSGIQAGIVRIIFEDAQVGYAFTDQGTVFRTENGGQNWFDYGTLPYVGLNEVSKFGTKVYFCGEWGVLGKMESPKPPTRPGFISGDQLVCSGDAAEYSVASNNNLNYYWSIAGATVTSNGNHASVKFPTGGQYTLSVQHYTACGTSATRTLLITVNDPPQPVILGPSIVSFNSTVEFAVESPEPSSIYGWGVTGATSFTESGPGAVDVTWGKDPGDVMVIETTSAGCRAKETIAVSIDPSTIVGVPDANVIEAGVRVYPNPTSGNVFVESMLSSGLEVRVVNLMGQEYDVKQIDPFGIKSINFGGLPKGLYLVEIAAPGGKSKAVKKVIRN